MVSDAADLLQLMNEHRTRKTYIDPELKKRDWLAKYIKEEVNSVKSDFNKKDFVMFDGA